MCFPCNYYFILHYLARLKYLDAAPQRKCSIRPTQLPPCPRETKKTFAACEHRIPCACSEIIPHVLAFPKAMFCVLHRNAGCFREEHSTTIVCFCGHNFGIVVIITWHRVGLNMLSQSPLFSTIHTVATINYLFTSWSASQIIYNTIWNASSKFLNFGRKNTFIYHIILSETIFWQSWCWHNYSNMTLLSGLNILSC